MLAAGAALSRGGNARAALGDVGNTDFAYLDAVGGSDASSASASASDAATSALATRVSSRFSSDAWYSADRRAPSTVPSSASPYAAARAARAAPATNDFAYLESKDEADAVVSVDARPKSTLGRSDATTAVAGNVPGDDANDPPRPAGDGPDGLPVPGTPLEPLAGPAEGPETSPGRRFGRRPRRGERFCRHRRSRRHRQNRCRGSARAAALVAFDVETASARASGGGFVYAGGKGRCRRRLRLRRSPRGRRAPCTRFTEELGADLFFVGDSTDKLLLISGCSALLPEDEQCDPAMARVGIPATTQLPHNMRPFVAEARDASLGYSMLGDAPRPFQTRDEAGCCAYDVKTVKKEEDEEEEARCCMTSAEARTASACVAGAGAAGALHVLAGEGPYDAASAREDVSEYEGYDLPRSTPERVETALRDFTKWAALRRRFANEGTRSETTAASPRSFRRRSGMGRWRRLWRSKRRSRPRALWSW